MRLTRELRKHESVNRRVVGFESYLRNHSFLSLTAIFSNFSISKKRSALPWCYCCLGVPRSRFVSFIH